MLCLEFPPKSFYECDFDYPDEMRKLLNLLEADNIKINCDLKTLEKLWYAFSEIWEAHFLSVSNNDTYPRFLKWVRDVDIDTADHMNYYGTVTNEVYRPWDNKTEEDDDNV